MVSPGRLLSLPRYSYYREILWSFEGIIPMKHYYAYYCPYGRCTYESFNGNAHFFFQFDSKESRTKWLEEHWGGCDTYEKFVAVKRADVEEALGKNFEVISHTCLRKSAVPRVDPYDVWLYGINPYDDILEFEEKLGVGE